MIALKSYVKDISDDYFQDLLIELGENTNDQLILHKIDQINSLISINGYTTDIKVKIVELKEELDNVSRFEPNEKEVIGQQQLIF